MTSRPTIPTARVALLFASMIAAVAGPARAEAGPDEVVVVVNDSSAISVAIGDYYALVRGIPPANVCHLPFGTTTAETISRGTFNASVRDPIASFLETSGLRDAARYLVLTKGVPLRISSQTGGGLNDDAASVDSELVLLFTGSLGDAGQEGWMANPFFGSEKPFDRYVQDGGNALKYLVCRLDGYSMPLDPGTGVPADIKGLIDRGSLPAEPGTFLLDADSSKGAGYAVGNVWMEDAESTLLDYGEPVVRESTTTFVHDAPAIAGYASWGSNDCCTAGPPYYGEIPAGSGRVFPGTFARGALTTDYVSTSARTFADGAGYGQSLVADLVKLGATGCNGHVFEPYLDAVSRPQQLFPRWAMGFTAADAFYASIPFVSWMNVVVADPLARRASYGPPSVLGVSPASGTIRGGGDVEVQGAEFRGYVEVFFGGVRSIAVSRPSPTRLVARVPPGAAVGPADVTVRTTFGEATLAGGYSYEALPVGLALLSSPRVGQPCLFEVTGPPAAPFALLIDKATGSTCKLGGSVCFGLAFTRELRVLHDSITGPHAPLDALGARTVTFTLPSSTRYVFRVFHAQAVVETSGPPSRSFETTGVVSSSIFP